MKRYMAWLVAGLFLVGVVNAANATIFPDTEVFNGTDGLLLSGDSGAVSPLTWTHDTPGDFEVPWDIVNSATLELNIERSPSSNSPGGVVTVETITFANIKSWNEEGNFYTTDIGSVFALWSPGQLDISWAWHTPNDTWMRLYSSTFTLNYDNGTAPAPEPATMLLFGSGLAGLVGMARRRIRTNAQL